MPTLLALDIKWRESILTSMKEHGLAELPNASQSNCVEPLWQKSNRDPTVQELERVCTDKLILHSKSALWVPVARCRSKRLHNPPFCHLSVNSLGSKHSYLSQNKSKGKNSQHSLGASRRVWHQSSVFSPVLAKQWPFATCLELLGIQMDTIECTDITHTIICICFLITKSLRSVMYRKNILLLDSVPVLLSFGMLTYSKSNIFSIPRDPEESRNPSCGQFIQLDRSDTVTQQNKGSRDTLQKFPVYRE